MTFNSSLSSVFKKCVSGLDKFSCLLSTKQLISLVIEIKYPVGKAQADSRIREFKFYIKITNGHEKKGRGGGAEVQGLQHSKCAPC